MKTGAETIADLLELQLIRVTEKLNRSQAEFDRTSGWQHQPASYGADLACCKRDREQVIAAIDWLCGQTGPQVRSRFGRS